MLFLLFTVGADRYALPAAQVRELLPLVDLKRIPLAPTGVAGSFNLRGEAVPVIDLSALMTGVPARALSDTRIVLVDYRGRKLGLIAEHASETLHCEDSAFVAAGVRVEAAPYLGPVVTLGHEVIQRIAVADLLPAGWSEILFAEAEVAA